ncbi:methyltransferase domain-containing protein [Sphingomonas sp. LB-2]|uniref:CheR family methyltransferase n=1 Tax=Sphingomonas caeni TaxID=2984949 RepID=UPI00222FC284|nr:CheR family methyltransferase [Sphingomonas caeni]MCW3846577.1 methyltransferase domain-containing protein [Sphingomonas caeni]
MNAALDIGEVDRFRESVLRWLGLDFDDSKRSFLLEVLGRRVHANGRDAGAYLAALEGPEGPRDELRTLAQELTVTETSFFRNADQIRALNEVALPDRMAARADTRQLSLLSAGCASGEEAYTLAACTRDMPGIRDWSVAIRAVDINTAMLRKAAAARYSEWSLRSTTPALIRSLFHLEGRDHVLDESVRRMVKFEERNLTVEDEGFWSPGRFDIIFCRNVIMYFTPEIARSVLARIARSLAPGGYLFLGHAESLRGMSTAFHLRHTHDTFYYQRRDGADAEQDSVPPPLPAAAIPAPIDPDESWVDTIRNASQRIRALTDASKPGRKRAAVPATPAADVRTALDLLGREHYAEAQKILDALPPERARDPEVLLLSAVLQTHGGKLIAAEAVCEELLRLDEMNAGAHYLMALCRESAGDFARAADHDQIAAYLDPSFAMPRLHLGLLARRAGDREGAARELRQALLLLQREDSARLLVFGGGFGRDALMTLCRAELTLCGEAA